MDADFCLQDAVAQILSSVLWLQVLDLQGIVAVAESTVLILFRFPCAVFEEGEDGLPPPSFFLSKPPLLRFKGASAGEQESPTYRHLEIMT